MFYFCQSWEHKTYEEVFASSKYRRKIDSLLILSTIIDIISCFIMKNVLIVLGLIIAFAGGYFISQKYDFRIEDKTSPKDMTAELSPSPSPLVTDEPMVGADIDEYGCKPSTGYSWCESKKKCIRAWEESCDPQEEIARALADKHQWNIDDIIVTVSKSDAKFARGSVRDKSSEVGGGMFLAVKIDNQWEIAFDGNGAPDCTLLKANYSIPQDFLLGICD